MCVTKYIYDIMFGHFVSNYKYYGILLWNNINILFINMKSIVIIKSNLLIETFVQNVLVHTLKYLFNGQEVAKTTLS